MHRRAQDYSKPCPAVVPTTAQLAARATHPETPVKPNAAVPYKFVTPEGFTAGRCNAYVPNGPTTRSRYLWTVQYFIANGETQPSHLGSSGGTCLCHVQC